MLRSYTPADFFTLGNASCGTIAVFLCLNYIAEGSNRYFWIAFVLTRPFGATMGDLLTKTPDKGGLGFGTIGSTAVLLAVLIALIAYTRWRAGRGTTAPA